ncbi:MAG: hypothetical protein LPK58_04095 [Gammaproteobacteria bacterium]|nr:hypothetical protein [Gammaproteobacteria bacterium]MDX5374864.1 hypothetical protein [Gammaproteobacteria bacterium]
MSKSTSTFISAATGALVVASLSAPAYAAADTNPFAITSLQSGYMVAAAEGKCGEGKCGGASGAKQDAAEGKCGEGKCGGAKKDAAEGKCGEGKCGGSR